MDPSDLGFSAERLDRAGAALAAHVEKNDPPLPGAVLLVGRGERWLPPRSFGRMGPEPAAAPMRPDAIFPLASITKPVVHAAFLQLVEAGAVGLNDLVARHWPEFAGAGKAGVRVIHLLTHTSGLPESVPGFARHRRALAPLERYLEELPEAPLEFLPGTELQYSNLGTLALAELLRRHDGVPTAESLRRRIFDPLGMAATALGTARLPAERVVRIAAAGQGYEADCDWNSPYWQRLGVPWGGLFAAAEDLAKLAGAMLAGRRRGSAILSAATTRLFTSNALDSSRLPELADRVRRRERWGLGWKLNAPAGSGGTMVDLLDDAVFGHQGVTGTVLWMDPRTEAFCVLLTSAGGVRAPWRLVGVSNMVAAALAGQGLRR